MDFDLGPPTTRPASPIADLSYRGYDGPLSTRLIRWWIVALAGIRLNVKKWWFWALAALCALPYLGTGIMLFANGLPIGGTTNFTRTFYESFAAGFEQFLLFVVALIVGSSSISADNRANALLVYLSKPVTKGDYLLGKWVGVFLLLFAVVLVPALILYLACLLSFTGQGFFRDDPWLSGRSALACVVAAAIHASLILGFSSWSKSPRMAGAIYASLYLVSGIVAGIAGSIYTAVSASSGQAARGILISHLSIGGIIKGLAQNIYHLTEHSMRFDRKAMQPVRIDLTPPTFWVMLALALAMIVVGLVATRAKVRAVEVVRG